MPTANSTPPVSTVKRQIVEYLERVPFERAIEQTDFQTLLHADSATPHPLFTKDTITALMEAREVHHIKRVNPMPGAFFSNKSVLIVPGFMGSQLREDRLAENPPDNRRAGNGLIWIDPTIYTNPAQLSDLRLDKFKPNTPDRDAVKNVAVREDGAVPILYAGLKYYLESGRCECRTAAFDWRKDIDESADRLVETIRSFANEHARRPFFLIAHSQGSLVARRAIQILGREAARRLINRLILLGPASFGTFSAAFAIAGNHSMIASLAHYGLSR
jgi:pimeloyl-ACP methyl ester carboxylesterase